MLLRHLLDLPPPFIERAVLTPMRSAFAQGACPRSASRAPRNTANDGVRPDERRAAGHMAVRAILRAKLNGFRFKPGGQVLAEQRARGVEGDFVSPAAAWWEERLILHRSREESSRAGVAVVVIAGGLDHLCCWLRIRACLALHPLTFVRVGYRIRRKVRRL